VLARALGWITLERLAYIAIAVLALILRLANLHVAPMSPAEAIQAMAALDLVADRGALPAAGPARCCSTCTGWSSCSPRPAETSARLLPALAGTATVLLAYGLRAELGRLGALGAASLLAVSSTLVFWSRSATGESLALLAGMALLVGWPAGGAQAAAAGPSGWPWRCRAAAVRADWLFHSCWPRRRWQPWRCCQPGIAATLLLDWAQPGWCSCWSCCWARQASSSCRAGWPRG
jgi:hypothetical protein